MAYKVELSELAEDDLSGIIRHFYEELLIPQSAKRFYKAVSKQIDLISENPYMYPLHHDEKLHKEGYRFVTINKYLMFYTINDVTSKVSIIRIVFGGRNLPFIFPHSGD